MTWYFNLSFIWSLFIVKPFLFYFKQIIVARFVADWITITVVVSRHARHWVLARMSPAIGFGFTFNNPLVALHWVVVSKQKRVFKVLTAELFFHLFCVHWWAVMMTRPTTVSWACFKIALLYWRGRDSKRFWVVLRSERWNWIILWNKTSLTLFFVIDA